MIRRSALPVAHVYTWMGVKITWLSKSLWLSPVNQVPGSSYPYDKCCLTHLTHLNYATLIFFFFFLGIEISSGP